VSEFDLINHFFKTSALPRDDVLQGVGDDCALLAPPPGKQLAISTDTLISGVHFPQSTLAADIGYKSLAVNLSDLAAMGASPAWASLAISLPEADQSWLANFMQGFNELARTYNVSLVGGDTTCGPLTITLNIVGFVDEKKALKRNRAKAGDLIFMTGTLGDAVTGLNAILNKTPLDKNLQYCVQRLNRPEPQINAGLLLTRFRVAAIDISDGLLTDLNHICTASKTGADIFLNQLPLSDSLKQYYAQGDHQPDWQTISCGGDDYELCFSCDAQSADEMLKLFKAQQIKVTQIGHMTSGMKINCIDAEGKVRNLQNRGYNHFNEKQ